MTDPYDRRSDESFPQNPLDFQEELFRRLATGAWQGILLAGTLTTILGIMVLAWPHATLTVAGVLFGIYLLITGIMQLVAAFGTHASTSMRVLAFISGGISIMLGLFCFRGTLESTFLLALWIGIGWMFRGIMQLMASSDPAMPARGWQIALGIVTLLAGIVLIVAPFGSLHVLTIVAGIWLIVVGLTEMFTGFGLRHALKHAEREGSAWQAEHGGARHLQ